MTMSDNQENQSWTAAGIGAITLFVEDLEVAKAFYLKVFDLPLMFEDAHSAVFNFGNTIINLLQVAQAPELINPANIANKAGGARSVFSIEVEDVDAMCADLAERGVTLLNGPMDRPWGIRTASFQDPDGYIWEIGK